MKKLLVRTLTGAFFVALVTFSVLFSPTVLFNVFLVFACLGLYEYRSMLQQKGIRLPVLFYVIGMGVYFLLSVEALQFPFQRVLLLAFCLLLLFMVAGLFRKDFTEAVAVIGYGFMGILWIVLPFSLLNLFPLVGGKALAHLPSMGQWLLLAFFITVWANDTFAYLVGSLFGKHAMCARISPKKTWEGTLGGALLTLALACFYSRMFGFLSLSVCFWAGFAILTVLMGTLGDLVESMFKRFAGVKDSGNILPGHGGVLDRFDSTLMALPFVTLYVILLLK